jgi:hypothetical protein
MDGLPDVPNGSVIERLVTPAGVTLRWPLWRRGLDRYIPIALLTLWLAGWVIAGGEVLADTFTEGDPPEFPFYLIRWIWTGGWAIGATCMVYVLWRLVRPERPEAVQLEPERLLYDPGWAAVRPWTAVNWDNPGPEPARAGPPPPAEIPRSAVRAFLLDRAGGRQQLWLDCGTERREIGAGLTEPDREWLYAALQAWHSSRWPPEAQPCGPEGPGRTSRCT